MPPWEAFILLKTSGWRADVVILCLNGFSLFLAVLIQEYIYGDRGRSFMGCFYASLVATLSFGALRFLFYLLSTEKKIHFPLDIPFFIAELILIWVCFSLDRYRDFLVFLALFLLTNLLLTTRLLGMILK